MQVVEAEPVGLRAEVDELPLRREDGGVEVALRGSKLARSGERPCYILVSRQTLGCTVCSLISDAYPFNSHPASINTKSSSSNTILFDV